MDRGVGRDGWRAAGTPSFPSLAGLERRLEGSGLLGRQAPERGDLLERRHRALRHVRPLRATYLRLVERDGAEVQHPRHDLATVGTVRRGQSRTGRARAPRVHTACSLARVV